MDRRLKIIATVIRRGKNDWKEWKNSDEKSKEKEGDDGSLVYGYDLWRRQSPPIVHEFHCSRDVGGRKRGGYRIKQASLRLPRGGLASTCPSFFYLFRNDINLDVWGWACGVCSHANGVV